MNEEFGAERVEHRYRVQTIDGLGLEYGVLKLRHTPPEWVTAGEQLAREVAHILGDHAIAVEHIGSTAVTGMLAKPIIDLAVGVGATQGALEIERMLVGRGWIYRGDAGDAGGHVFVLERRPSFRVAHAHVVDHEGDQWCRYLILLHRLRTDPSARAAYEAAKVGLRDEFGENRREAYTEGKTAIVTHLID